MEFGDYRIEIIPDTEFRLDGGAMFGVVPRVLWERRTPPDEQNRIALNMNCLFIDTGNEKILVDTGIGEKWAPKQCTIYGIRRERPFAESLKVIAGCEVDDIDIVINTHLHFDHAGGNTIVRDKNAIDKVENSQTVPQFPNARYFVSASELEHAKNPHERDKASYLAENWQPLIATGQLETRKDSYEAVPGLQMQTVRGHTATMQTVRLSRGGRTLYGFADLIPTTHHLPLPWIMGYDLFPAETLEAKRSLISEAIENDWLCLFYHEVDQPLRHIEERDGQIEAIHAGA